jgi:hydrogenase nickel incorporation protein HypA/HybF
MHELGITQEIVAIAVREAGGAQVTGVVVEIGRLTAVLPDAIRFCFDLCAEGTPAEGAALCLIEVSARGRCRACGDERAFDQPFGWCACGSSDLEWVAGEELRVRSIEVALGDEDGAA